MTPGKMSTSLWLTELNIMLVTPTLIQKPKATFARYAKSAFR
jgi:hypothetical protein